MQNRDAALEELMLTKQNDPYRVQINDVLSIRFKALDQELVGMFNPIASESNIQVATEKELYFDGFSVDNHGEVSIPTLGKVSVLNLTIEEIKEKIEEKLLADYVKKEANVFVTVKLGGVKYTVLGEVVEPGVRVLYQDRVNIFEAIANAGDLEVVADRKDVMIMRPYPGGYKIHHLDLTEKSIIQSPYFYIQPNDMIYVKPLPQKTWGTGKTGLESFTTVLTIFSAITTTILLLRTL